jgi:hypothetical protein
MFPVSLSFIRAVSWSIIRLISMAGLASCVPILPFFLPLAIASSFLDLGEGHSR